jgi:hypothetical protein
VLVVLPLEASADKTKLAAHLKVSGSKHVRMGTSEQVFSRQRVSYWACETRADYR